jgi:hypothetical protein
MVFHGKGVVWDAKNDKRLCKFENGKFETSDKRVIGILKNAGYDAEPVIEPVEQPEKPPKLPRKKASA